MRKTVGLLGTLIVHGWALLLIVSEHRAPSLIQRYAGHEKDAEVTLIATDGSADQMSRGHVGAGALCPADTKHYLGIGITFRASGAITSAPVNLPAGRAGIKPGDSLFERFPIFRAKQAARIRVMRAGQMLTFMIVPEMVCFREANPRSDPLGPSPQLSVFAPATVVPAEASLRPSSRYPMAFVDTDGKALNGATRYTLHFGKGSKMRPSGTS